MDTELEKMCKEIDEIVRKYGFLYVTQIKLKSFNKNPISGNNEISETSYDRII